MRGDDEQQLDVFKLSKPGGTNPPRASVASVTCHGRWGVAGAATEVWQAVRQDRAAIDSAGEAAVPLVRWPEHGRRDLGWKLSEGLWLVREVQSARQVLESRVGAQIVDPQVGLQFRRQIP